MLSGAAAGRTDIGYVPTAAPFGPESSDGTTLELVSEIKLGISSLFAKV